MSRVEQLTSGEVAYTYTVTGIQVAAVVGGADELERVKALTGHINEKVAADARASAFYLKKKIGAR